MQAFEGLLATHICLSSADEGLAGNRMGSLPVASYTLIILGVQFHEGKEYRNNGLY